MADYNRDEMRRQEQIEDSMKKSKEWPKWIKIGEREYDTFEIDISDDLFLRVAKQAHERDITFNVMVHSLIKDGLTTAEYKFEHENKPQFLTEYKWYNLNQSSGKTFSQPATYLQKSNSINQNLHSSLETMGLVSQPYWMHLPSSCLVNHLGV